jgi:hypothetical protein
MHYSVYSFIPVKGNQIRLSIDKTVEYATDGLKA